MTDIKIERFPLIEMPICEKKYSEIIRWYCVCEGIGNTPYHIGTVCCSRI